MHENNLNKNDKNGQLDWDKYSSAAAAGVLCKVGSAIARLEGYRTKIFKIFVLPVTKFILNKAYKMSKLTSFDSLSWE